MKYLALITILCFSSCSKKESTKNEVSNDNTEKLTTFSDLIIENDQEKISLLSIMKNIKQDTLSLVLRDYLDETEQTYDSKNSKIEYKNIIKSLSKKYNISEHKIANIIFSYKFEMVTEDEIIENSVNEIHDSQDSQDNSEDRY